MDRHPLATTDLAHPLVRLAFHAHGVHGDLEGAGERGPDAIDMGRELWSLGDDDRVDILDDKAGVADDGDGAAEQLEAVRIAILGISVWKILSDVTPSGGPR